MKKKLVILFTLVSLSTLPASAMAEEGKLTVDQKSVYLFNGKDSGWFYAKVENRTDTPIAFENANLILFSNDDDILMTQDYIDTFPSNMTIQPYMVNNQSTRQNNASLWAGTVALS